MFIFKKKEKPKEEKTTVPESLREKVIPIMFHFGKGLYHLLNRATPEQDIRKILKILDHEPATGTPNATRKSGYRKKYVYEATPEEEIIAVHYPLLHAFLALAMAYHSGVHNRRSADVVEELMSALYTNNRTYSYIKQNYKRLAEALACHAADYKIVTDPEKTAKVMEKAFEKTFKIIDKLLPEVNEKNLEVLGRALHKHTDDPFVVLRNAGIDIEPELKEFRQFLAEISGKKVEPAPKFKQVQREVEEESGRGMPEAKVIAPRLATAVWLDRWFENAVKSYTYKKLGGVLMDELKNFRNMLLAKKHVAEVATRVMGEHWMKGNLVKIGEEHVNKRMLPLVREHAGGMFEDLENIRKAVKERKMSVEEAIALMSLERNLLDVVHEHVEDLMGSPEHLARNPRPLGLGDEYVVKLSGIVEVHRKLKPHLEYH